MTSHKCHTEPKPTQQTQKSKGDIGRITKSKIVDQLPAQDQNWIKTQGKTLEPNYTREKTKEALDAEKLSKIINPF